MGLLSGLAGGWLNSYPSIDQAKKTLAQYFSNGYQPSAMDGIKLERALWDNGKINGGSKYGNGQYLCVGDTGLKGSVNTAGKNMDSQQVWTDGKNYYVWIGDGGKGGYYANIGSVKDGVASLVNNKSGYSATNFADVDASGISGLLNYLSTGTLNFSQWKANEDARTDIRKDTTPTARDEASNTNKGTVNKVSDPVNPNIQTGLTYEEQKALLDYAYALEHPYIPTADELAELYGIDLNEDNILSDYNAKTNDYYRELSNYFDQTRNRTLQDTLAYERNQLDKYLDSYNYQAPTGANRALKASNVVRNNIGGNEVMNTLDSDLVDQYNNIQDSWKAELAENPLLAKEHATALRTWLGNNSATINASNVKQYVAQLDAYADMYAAGRTYGNYANQATAAKYQGLVNAANTNAQSTAYGSAANNFAKMLDFYTKAAGGNRKQGATDYASTLKASYGSTN